MPYPGKVNNCYQESITKLAFTSAEGILSYLCHGHSYVGYFLMHKPGHLFFSRGFEVGVYLRQASTQDTGRLLFIVVV